MVPRFRLWHSVDTRSLRVLWLFKELDLERGRDYAMKTLPFPPRKHSPEFLESNILGTVPYFEHQENWDATPRAAMTESCAVSLYILDQFDTHPLYANMYPGVRRGNSHQYGTFLNWLFHADATLTFPQSVVMRYGIFEPGVAEAAADGYAKWFTARLRLLDDTLADGREFLCEGKLTIADICVAYALYNGCEHGICGAGLLSVGREPLSARYKPQTRAYLENMMERKAWLNAQAEQADGTSDF